MNKSVSIHSKQRVETKVIQPLSKWRQKQRMQQQKYLVIMRWHFLYTPYHTVVCGTKESADIYYYMFLQRRSRRLWTLSRRIKDAVHEFDHYCWISCDEEYEEMRSKKQLHARNNNAWNFAGKRRKTQGRSKKRMERWKINEKPKLRTEEWRKDDDRRARGKMQE